MKIYKRWKEAYQKNIKYFKGLLLFFLFHFLVEIKILKDIFKDHKEVNSYINNSNFATNEKPLQVRDIHSPNRAFMGKINYPIFQFPNIMTRTTVMYNESYSVINFKKRGCT